MENMKFRTKLAEMEADLVSASALGKVHLHAEVCRKLASLIENEDDLQLVMDRLADYDEVKNAGFGDKASKAIPVLSLAALASGPLMAGANWLSKRRAKDQAWGSLQQDPEIMGEDPSRAKAMFDLLHSTSPHLATNPVVARDLMKQMTSMPMIDLGTAGALARTGKDIASLPGQDGLGSAMSGGLQAGMHASDTVTGLGKRLPAPKPEDTPEKMSSLVSSAQALMGEDVGVPVQWTSSDGMPCAFNWATPALKEAGVTDAFMGHGDMMQQADNAHNMKVMQDGLSLLPLDAVVRELLMKEQELAQREDVMAQQEAQVQQAMQQMQQMQQMYSQQYGVDPQAQQPMTPEAPDQGYMPEEGAPVEGAEPAAPPMDGGEAMEDDQLNASNPVPNEGGETAIEAGGQEPPVEGEDPTGGAEPTTTEGFDDEAGMGEASFVSDESALEGEDEYDETVPGDLDGDGEDDLNADGEINEEDLPPGMTGDIDGDGETDGDRDGEVSEEGLAEEAAEEASEAVSPGGVSEEGEEGEIAPEGEEMAPEGDLEGEENLQDTPKYEMDQYDGSEGGEPTDQDGDPEADAQDLDAEDIEGTYQDELDHHTGPDALPEGSPEDQEADEELAESLDDAGIEPQPVPGGAPHEMVGSMDGGPAPEEMAGDPVLGAPPAPEPATPQPEIGPDGSMNITVPLPAIQVSIKMAEKCAEERLQEERGEYYRTMGELFRPE